MARYNLVQEKSYQFACRIFKLYKYLIEKNKEFVISRQILKSGTSIGANVEEAIGAQSPRDFILKFSIAYKESRETIYWLRLLKDNQELDVNLADSLMKDCEELQKIITKILKTSKAKSINS